MTSQSVCAVVVTYRPSSVMLEHFQKVLLEVPTLVVVDNGSDVDELNALRNARKNLGFHLIENGKNLGIAEALNQGVLWAKQQGYPWVLLLDQDSKIMDRFVGPMFKAWLSHPQRDAIVSIYPRYSHPQLGYRPLAPTARDGSRLWCMTSGTLMPTWVFDQIGWFASEFFIDWVDIEYCFRIRKAGYLIIESQDSVLLHDPGQSAPSSVLGFQFWPSHHSPARRYYMFRNRVAVFRKYFFALPGCTLIAIDRALRDTAKCFLGEKDRVNKFRSFVLGTWDGLRGRMGPRDGFLVNAAPQAAGHALDDCVASERTQQSERFCEESLFQKRSEATEPCVYIVLLNWNGWRDTVDCIRSLRSMEYRNWRVLVVDNGSTNDSVERLRELRPEVPVEETHRNLGFAAGNNVGIRMALQNGADYVFVLNNDTTVSPDAVSKLVEFAEKHPDAAMLGPRIYSRDVLVEWPIRKKLNLLTLLCTFTPLRRLTVRLPVIRRILYCTGNHSSIVQFLPGSALFFRAKSFEKIGLFDETTFLDFEDLIMAAKVKSAGLSAYYVPQARIVHKGSASGSKLQAKRYIENAKSEEYFFSHYVRLSPFGRTIFRLIRLFMYTARALRHRYYREHFPEFINALRPRHSVKPG